MNIAGVRDLVGSKTNKTPFNANYNEEGVEGEPIDELTLDLPDEKLLKLKDGWELNYAGYEAKLKVRQDKNKTYYLGTQAAGMTVGSPDPIAGNILFEAAETFYPAALAKNPEPVVYSDNSPEGNAISGSVKTMLQYHADTLALREKLTLMTRHHSIYFIGVLKHGWNEDIKDISTEVRDPRNFIFDPDGFVDVYADYEGPLGEKIEITAAKLVELFPKHEEYITILANGKMGTKLVYTEWWNDDYCFYTLKGKVLDKHKNPHFNYDKEVPKIGQDGLVDIDIETGKTNTDTQPGKNHFSKPKKPFTFLTVFSLQEQPHDITGLIEQNIPNQNIVTRRTYQIDKNLNVANNSIALDGSRFNEETGKQAAQALEKGNPVLVPGSGDVNGAIVRFAAPSYPEAAFNQLNLAKEDLRSIFGVQGISSQEPNEETTARGMILQQQFDNTRIGGSIGGRLETVADNVFNWWVQLYRVYYDVPHFASVLGQMKATEYIELSNKDLTRHVTVSVAPDSMAPKDEVTQMNQAQTLFDKQVIGPKTLLTILNFPDPAEATEDGLLYKLDPQAYLQINAPELHQQLMQMQQQNQAQQGAPQAPPGNPAAPQTPLGVPSPLSSEPANAALSQVQLPK